METAARCRDPTGENEEHERNREMDEGNKGWRMLGKRVIPNSGMRVWKSSVQLQKRERTPVDFGAVVCSARASNL